MTTESESIRVTLRRIAEMTKPCPCLRDPRGETWCQGCTQRSYTYSEPSIYHNDTSACDNCTDGRVAVVVGLRRGHKRCRGTGVALSEVEEHYNEYFNCEGCGGDGQRVPQRPTGFDAPVITGEVGVKGRGWTVLEGELAVLRALRDAGFIVELRDAPRWNKKANKEEAAIWWEVRYRYGPAGGGADVTSEVEDFAALVAATEVAVRSVSNGVLG